MNHYLQWLRSYWLHSLFFTLLLWGFAGILYVSGLFNAGFVSEFVETRVALAYQKPQRLTLSMLLNSDAPIVGGEDDRFVRIDSNLPLGSLAFSDVFDTSFSSSLPKTITFFVSYDIAALIPNSFWAKDLFVQTDIFYADHPAPWIYAIEWNTESNTFLFPNGSTALLLPGMIISLSASHDVHYAFVEIPYYQQLILSSQRASLSDFDQENYHKLALQQVKNFRSFFYQDSEDGRIDPESGQISTNVNGIPFSSLIKKVPSDKDTSMHALGYVSRQGIVKKLLWNAEEKTYVDALASSEQVLYDGDRVVQIALNGTIDFDGFVSTPYIDYGNDITGCSKTKRLNGYMFDVKLPYGAGPYETSKKVHVGNNFLGASSLPFRTIEEFDADKDNRWHMLHPQSFPEGTDFIEIVFHSSSVLGREYGHGNIAFLYQGDWRVFDPYVEVPGYTEQSPKLLQDYIASKKASNNLSIAQIFYYDTNKQISSMSLQQMEEYIRQL